MTGLKTSIRVSGLADESHMQNSAFDVRTVIRVSTFAGSETSNGTSGLALDPAAFSRWGLGPAPHSTVSCHQRRSVRK